MSKVIIVGAGLAGVEAAWYLLNKGVDVALYEMRPKKMTEAHTTGDFAELLCSNSLRSNSNHSAIGLLKREMEAFNSIVMRSAKESQIPAGSSLAVDRGLFSMKIKEALMRFPNFTFLNEEYIDIDINVPTIIAAGPLVSASLSLKLEELLGEKLYFFDAVAPIISKKSINMDICYYKNRYEDKKDYINCPMTKEEYDRFYQELINAKTVELKEYERNIFEGCVPIEVMAKRGYDTMRFGPLKPIGLEHNGNKYYAVVQLRQDDYKDTLYNLVGFQTNLLFIEQKRVFGLIPGLENIDIIRYGVMHRNTYINSPKHLNNGFQVIKYPNIFIAGQISGVEGYVESAGSGLNAAINMYQYLINKTVKGLSDVTIMGAMAKYVSTNNTKFVPMNANYGLIKELEGNYKKKDKKEKYLWRSLEYIDDYIKEKEKKQC